MAAYGVNNSGFVDVLATLIAPVFEVFDQVGAGLIRVAVKSKLPVVVGLVTSDSGKISLAAQGVHRLVLDHTDQLLRK